MTMKKLFLGLLLLSSCSPATPPVPPAELPALIFPRTVRIDTSKIQSQESSASEGAALVGAGGTFSDIIASGADLADAANEVVEVVLDEFRSLSIELSTTTTTFTGVVSDETGTFDVKIDFADYDLDGDGGDEGCSGHTAALPVCFRVWLDGDRFMAGLFTQYPTETNPGAGEFRVGLNSALTAAGEDLLFSAVYNHFDPEDKATELFTAGTQTADPTSDAFLAAHIELTQEGEDATARKTVNVNADVGPNAFQTDHLEYVGRYLENRDFWSGSAIATTAAGGSGTFTDVCAVISTGNAASDPDSCEDLDIDVGGIAFTDAVAFSDVQLPDDFPAAPTF